MLKSVGRLFTVGIVLFANFILNGQVSDTTKYGWPIGNMSTQINIGGTFGEYRSTSTAGHYHNGTDVSGAAGTPVYAVLPGIVRVAYHDGSTGYDSYVRVESTINGQSKHITYYHTIPTVSVGQNVTLGQQISTIAIDHVHLIEYRLGTGVSSTHLNAIRPDGGLVPYVDSWKPFIRYVKFHVDNSATQLSPSQLGGKVDIIVHVEEGNGTSSAALNNGTYEIGYKILSEDRQTVVYNPADNGLRFKYYNKPADGYVNTNYYQPESNTSKHVYIVTNGHGASYVANNQMVLNNFWDTDALPYGPYTVMVFAKDTRGNTDTVYIPVVTTEQDLIAPGQPQLRYVKKDSTNYFSLAWNEPVDADVKGYRLYYSFNGNTYQLRDGESALPKGTNQKQYYFNQSLPLYFKISAVDTVFIPNVSIQSDVYGVRMGNDGNKILIVDGFNRFGGSGSWNQPYQDFVVKHAETFSLSFESCHHTEIISGNFDLRNYSVVIWILGDESTNEFTFDDIEQAKVKEYLESGGKLFVSGSEIAWELGGPSSTTAMQNFLQNYLKAKYISDDSGLLSAAGIQNSFFQNITLPFGLTSSGSPYAEDYPDVIDTINGSVGAFVYGTTQSLAGISYKGKFGNSVTDGALFYLGFPFETINTLQNRTALMNKVFQYFDLLPVGINSDFSEVIHTYNLEQNYPNPFNPSTVISFSLPKKGIVKLRIYDILGSEIVTLINNEMEAGKYSYDFDISNYGKKISSGVLLYRLETEDFSQTKKMIYLK
ncbi:MAG: T9SS type A sorting domain-containing protein [Ignavibacteriaceae bacterium]|nr:T9SS type A sorting domain-containing protein [Ignavibacteriaceae bacterium]